MAGPLQSVRILEFAGIGPGPFAAMLLADLGAEVVRIERVQAVAGERRAGATNPDVMQRGRRSIAVDLKSPQGIEVVLDLVERADALIEGFRPGVMERLGLSPEACKARNARLVYGRMTGWGQDGPMAPAAGHDINYISLAGVLAHIGRAGEAPVPPLNLVGDFGGGGMLLAFGIVSALLEAQRSGHGQVVDAAMVDGAATLMAMFWTFKNVGIHDTAQRGVNMLDSGAHFYDVYRTADDRYVSIGSIETQFYALLLDKLGLTADPEFAAQMDRSRWPALKARLAEVFATRTRDEWCAVFEGTDVCFAPVLTMEEAAAHPHNVARGTFVEIGGVTQPAPAPRFSRTAAAVPAPPAIAGAETRAVLGEWGIEEARVAELLAAGVVRQA